MSIEELFYCYYYYYSTSYASLELPHLISSHLIIHFLLIYFLECEVKDVSNLSAYKNLTTLIVDKNNLINLEMFPVIKTLQTLWCNNNEIEDLVQFMNNVCKKFENLRYLSMMRNPACPSLMNISGRIYLSIYLSIWVFID